ncbi:MAG: hypothetical protein ABI723_18345 [Bacteroidia bacterium]
MKRILIVFFIVSNFLKISAQQLKVNWGTDFNNSLTYTVANVLLDNGTNIYTSFEQASYYSMLFDNTKVKPRLVKCDGHMKPIKEREYTTDQKNVQYYGTYNLGGGFFILTSVYDKNSSQRIMYMQKLNMELEPDGAIKEVMKIAGEKDEFPTCNICFSEDSSKVCIMVIKPSKKKENIKMALKVYDASYKPVMEKQFEIENSEDDKIVIGGKMVNNKGEVYIMSKEFINDNKKEETKSEMGKRVPGYSIVLTKHMNETSAKRISMDLGESFCYEYYLGSDHKGNPVIIAQYEEEFASGINGIYFYKIDNAKETIETKKYEIPQAIGERVTEFQGDKIGSKKPAISRGFSVREFKVYDDESMAFVLERNIYSNGEFYSDAILVGKLDKNCEVKWFNYIPKLQHYSGFSNFLYHATMFHNDKIYIFYNDALANENYDLVSSDKAPKRFQQTKMNLTMVIIDQNGKMSKSIIGSKNDFDTDIDIGRCSQISENRMLLVGYKYFAKEVKLGTLEF